MELYLEERGDSPLDVEGVLVVSGFRTDDILDVAVVEVQTDRPLDFGDVAVFLNRRTRWLSFWRQLYGGRC